MGNFDSINLLPGHVAVDNLELKSDTSKVQKTASRIGFIFKSLFISHSASIVYFGILLSLFSYLHSHLPYFLTISE